MTVTQKLFKILSKHDVANGRTDGRTPYHNASKVSLQAYKKPGMDVMSMYDSIRDVQDRVRPYIQLYI